MIHKYNKFLERRIVTPEDPYGEEFWDPEWLDEFEKSKKVDIYDYTEEDLKELGFAICHPEHFPKISEPILLVPLKYFYKLKDGVELETIGGRHVVVGED
jgi:hypothetical protein